MKTFLIVITVALFTWIVSTQFSIQWPQVLTLSPEIKNKTSELFNPPVISEEEYLVNTAKEVHILANKTRLNKGIPTTEWDNELYKIAKKHSQAMATKGELFHSDMKEPYAENCWWGGGSISYWEPKDILESWMNSEKHRTWVLCPTIKHIGVGISIAESGVYVSWTFWREETKDSDWWYIYNSEPPVWHR